MTSTPEWLAAIARRSDADRRRSRTDPDYVLTQSQEDRRALLLYIETLQADAMRLVTYSLKDWDK